MMPTLSILMPSRLERDSRGKLFLESAVSSIRAQAGHSLALQILVGIDTGACAPPGTESLGVKFVESAGRSQAAALNAAAGAATGDFIAILEDDDQWNPGFLFCAFSMLKEDFDFSSSTQLEVTPDGKIIRVSEFPTPSGWVMRRKVWDQVGLFNEEYRFHLDNEWLGRLGETDARRVHLCEATTPMDYNTLPQSRPFLGELLQKGKPKVELARHDSPWPLVVRLCHPGSGMAQVRENEAARERSNAEAAQLEKRFGHRPW
jgi:hypothetical protein